MNEFKLKLEILKIQHLSLVLFLFVFLLFGLFFVVTKETYAVSYCGSPDSGVNGTIQKGLLYTSNGAIGNGNECSSGLPSQGGSFQIVPDGHALTAIGYGSDDRRCMIGISTAPVNPDGTVDFSQNDYNQFDYCANAPGARNRLMVQYEGSPYDNILRGFSQYGNQKVPTGHVVTGWIWGANTSGGIGSTAGNPAQECYYQEYMNLQTKQVFGWGSQYDGTCNEYGYGNVGSLQRVARAPAGRVITGIDFMLDQDANVSSMYVATRLVTAPPPPLNPRFDISISPGAGLDIIRGASATGVFVVSITNCSGGVSSVNLNNVVANRPISDIGFNFSRTTVPCTPGDNQAILTVSPGPNASPLSLPDGPYADIGLRVSGTANGFTNFVDTGLWVYERPSVNITANNSAGPITINATDPLVIRWSPLNTKNVQACSASGAWSGTKDSIHGQTYSQNITGLTSGQKVFSIQCFGWANAPSTVASVTVNVNGVAPIGKLDTLTISPANSTINVGANQPYTLTATFTNGRAPETVTLSSGASYVSLDGAFATMGSGSSRNVATGIATTSTAARIQATYTESYPDSTTVSRTAMALLNVNSVPFTANCPNSLSTVNNNTQTLSVPISVSPASGGSVNFTAAFVSGPSPRPSLNPLSGTLGSSNSYSTILSVGINNSIQAGTYNLQVNMSRSGVNQSCTVPIVVNTVVGPTLTRVDIFPNSIQLVVGQTQSFSAVATYSNGSTAVVTASSSFASTGNITMLGNTGQAGNVGSATVRATYQGITSSPASISVSDFTIACPSPANLTLVGSALPANTIVNMNFTVLPVNGFNKPVTTTITDASGVNLFSPNPRTVNMTSANYAYNLSVDMSGRGAGVYNISADSLYSTPLFSRRANGAPCIAQIVVGAVTNYNLQFDSIIGSVMQDDNTNPSDNTVGSPMIHQYRIQLTNCSGAAVTNGVQLKPLNLNGVTGAEFGYYEETSPGNFVLRGQTITIACNQTRYLRVNARDTLAPLNPNNTPTNNRSINFMSGTPGISDKQNNLVLTLYGRPRVTAFTASPASVTDIQSSNLTWTTAFVPTNGFYCNGTAGTGAWPGPKFNTLTSGVAGGTYATGSMPAGSRIFTVACGVSFRNSLYYSSPVSTTINVTPSGSNQPVNVSGDNSACGKITVRWQKPSTGLAPTGYKVYKFNGSSWVQMGATVNVTNSAQVSYSLDDPSPSAQNTYAVTSLQGVVESARTQASNNPVPLVVCASNPPESVLANNATCGKIFIDWKRPSSGIAPTSYRVYRWNSSTSVWQPIANVSVSNASVVDYRFEDPAPSATGNRYAVSSFQGALESVRVSASNNPIDLLSCTPNAPAITGTSTTCAGITINWNYGGTITLSRFRIYRNNAQITEVPATQFSYQDATPLSSNNYQISAISTTNIESSRSNTVSVGWSGCEPKLDTSNKRILSVDGVVNPFATQNPCDPNFTRLDLKARIDQPIVFLMNICNNGSAPLVAGAAPGRYVLIDDTKLTHLKKNGNSWRVKIQGNNCTQFPVWSAASATAPQCQYQDVSGGLRISLRNGTLPIGGIWQLQFEAITTVGPNENGDTFYYGNKATITYPKNTPPNGTKDIDTGLKTFIRGSGDGVKFIEIPPGS